MSGPRDLVLACTSGCCGRRCAIPAHTVIVAAAGRIDDAQPSCSISWTCPVCMWPCRRIALGSLGAYFLDSGATAHVPKIDDLTIAFDDDSTIVFVGRDINGNRQPCTLVHYGPALCPDGEVDKLAARFTFVDHAEALRWVAIAQHPAGGAA